MNRLRWRAGVFAAFMVAGAGAGLVAGTATVGNAWLRAGYGTIGGVAGLGGAVITDQVSKRRDSKDAARRVRAEVLSGVVTERLPGDTSVLGLLLATNAVAPFRARQADLAWLRKWCDDPAACPVVVLTGPAGVGKSRLAVEFASQRPEPWATGWLVAGRGGDAVAAVRACGDPALVLIDDAGERGDVADLVASLAGPARESPPVRVLLITRAEGLIGRLERALADQPRQVLANARERPVSAFGSSDDYARWFSEAIRAYAQAVRTPPPDLPPAASSWTFDASEPILAMQAQALLTVLDSQRKRPMYQGSQVPPFDQVAEALFRHEEHRWDTAAKAAGTGLPDFTGPDQVTAVACLVIASPADLDSAASALRKIPPFCDAPAERLGKVARWAASLYPGEPAWPLRIKPDLLAGWFVVSQLQQSRDLARLAAGLGPDQIRPLLMQVVGASNYLSQAVPIFAELLAADPIGRTEFAIMAAMSVAVRRRYLDAELADLIRSSSWPASALEALAAMLKASLPRTAAAVVEVKVSNARADADTARLAGALGHLGASLIRLGRYREALAADEEALALYRLLAADDPAHLPGLASALNGVGASLRGLGRPRDALAAFEEVLALYRGLAADDPAHLPGLASALNNLGVSLRGLGRPREALAADEEALALRRGLAADEPAHLPGLASALNGLGVSLRGLGRPREAQAADEEALALHRGLAADDPAHLPNLARSLNNLGASLTDLGQHREALAAFEEALALRQGLATDNPAHLPDLASSLDALGASLRDLGRHGEALAAFQEALALRQGLATDNPAHLPDLARSLNNLAIGLIRLGRHREALPAFQGAMALYQGLATDNPAHLPDLARSLNNLGASLTDLRRHREALAADEEAVALYQGLAADNPAHLPDLASSLNNLGASLRGLGRHREALTADEEAIGLWKNAAEMNPDRYQERYLRALAELRRKLARSGRENEAVRLGLGDDPPGDHKPDTTAPPVAPPGS